MKVLGIHHLAKISGWHLWKPIPVSEMTVFYGVIVYIYMGLQ